MKPKIVVVHPGRQHSFYTASALKKEGLLLKYITSVYDKKGSFSMFLTRLITSKADKERMKSRKCEFLSDDDVKIYNTFFSLLIIVFSRFSPTKKLSLFIEKKTSDIIGKKSAKYAIKHGADGVICFSGNESVCFEYLKKHAPNIKRITDCANSPLDFVLNIFNGDEGVESLKKEVPQYWSDSLIKRKRRGIDLTEYFLSPSSFVSRGLDFCGVRNENIYPTPFGVNFEFSDEVQKIPEKVKFIYVGQITYRKGLHHLLKAFSELDESITLDVVGGFPTGKELYEKYKDCKNITFHGSLLHGEVKKMLKSSNVFITLSLTESLSVACLEALGCALPLIASKNTGAEDFIIDGENGYTIEYSDTETLKKYVMELYSQPEKIPQMSEKALSCAKNYTWKNYENCVVAAIKNIFGT